MKYSCDSSALSMILLFVIIFMEKLFFTLLHADRQDRANSGFMVTAVSVDISQKTLSFSWFITLANVLESIFFRLLYLYRQLFYPCLLKTENHCLTFSVQINCFSGFSHTSQKHNCLNCNEKIKRYKVTYLPSPYNIYTIFATILIKIFLQRTVKMLNMKFHKKTFLWHSQRYN